MQPVLQPAWNAFLRALATARLGEVRKTTTPDGLRWVENFLNPDDDGFVERCGGLAKAWARTLRPLLGAPVDAPRAMFLVPFWHRAFFWFGPRITVYFKTTPDGLRVDTISFMGD